MGEIMKETGSIYFPYESAQHAKKVAMDSFSKKKKPSIIIEMVDGDYDRAYLYPDTFREGFAKHLSDKDVKRIYVNHITEDDVVREYAEKDCI